MTYDILGQVYSQSVPTEVAVSGTTWSPAGDDATRGWLWKYQKYDWKGRVIRTINTDGVDSPTLNDSDTLISYEGCGCAGGQVTTIQGELVPKEDGTGNARRTQKVYEDILGRQFKAETYQWDALTVYSTSVNRFNGMDQTLQSRQYAGTTSSTTYQDTTASFDGFGRMMNSHSPEQLNADGSPAHTSFTYNPDGSEASITDARGAISNYTYSDLGLLIQINNSIPFGSNMPNKGPVTFQYDSLGNRTLMTDDSGNISYQYNGLSQTINETRYFSDIFMSFTLSYEYDIGGGVSKIGYPNNVSVSYEHDRSGRISSVSGQGILDSQSNTNISNMASNLKYRAWNSIKSMNYGSPTNLSVEYDNALQISRFSVEGVIQTEYQYAADGTVRFAADLLDHKFDRSYEFDHLQRLTMAKSGTQASGGTVSDGPYLQSLSYNAFSNPTNRQTDWWATLQTNTAYSYVNNRRSGLVYDEDGDVKDNSNIFTKDSAGEIVSIESPVELQGGEDCTRSFHRQDFKNDGDGQIAIRGENRKMLCVYWSGDSVLSSDQQINEHYVKSSVLDGLVLFKYTTGTLYTHGQGTSVSPPSSDLSFYLHGKLLAYSHNFQVYTTSNQESYFRWNHSDPQNTKLFESQINTEGYWKTPVAELDPTGANVGFMPPEADTTPTQVTFIRGEMASPEPTENVIIDGVEVPISAFPGMMAISSQCPNNNCTIHTANGWEFWTAFADGAEGYLPARAYYAGNGRWSSQTERDRKKRNRKAKPTLHRSQKLSKPQIAKKKAEGMIGDEDEIPTNVDPPDFREPFFTKILPQVGLLMKLFNKRVKIIGFNDTQHQQILDSLVYMILTKECADAFKAANIPTPAEVMRDRGVVIAHNQLLESSANNQILGLTDEQRRYIYGHQNLKSGGFTIYEIPGPVYTFFHNGSFGDDSNFSWQERSVHERIHGSGVPSQYSIWGWITGDHDLSGYAPYSSILKNCTKPKTNE